MGEQHQYDLEVRTLEFAKEVDEFVSKLPRSIVNLSHGGQLVRSAGSVGANYIEANESLGKKDFLLHIKISRKESKESRYWLQLLAHAGAPEQEAARLIAESTELMKIFGAILRRSQTG